jgi:hypothetical protein
MCNIFLACEPLAGKRMVIITERKTKRYRACFREEIEVQHENVDQTACGHPNLNKLSDNYR